MKQRRIIIRIILITSLFSSFVFGVAYTMFETRLSESMLVILFAGLGPLALIWQIIMLNGITPGPVFDWDPHPQVRHTPR